MHRLVDEWRAGQEDIVYFCLIYQHPLPINLSCSLLVLFLFFIRARRRARAGGRGSGGWGDESGEELEEVVVSKPLPLLLQISNEAILDAHFLCHFSRARGLWRRRWR